MREEIIIIQNNLKVYVEKFPEPNPEEQFDVRCAMEYFNERLLRPGCSVKSMREYCRIPQNNFSGRFKRCTGFSPVGWISHHRIEAAKFLLMDRHLKDVPVSEIGFAVGYERASTFTTIFTNKTGMPPGEWRIQQLNPN